MILSTTDTRMLILLEDCQRRGVLRTEREFCEAIGFTHTNLAKVKQGQRSFTVDQLAAAGDRFGVDMNWLYGFELPTARLPLYRKRQTKGQTGSGVEA